MELYDAVVAHADFESHGTQQSVYLVIALNNAFITSQVLGNESGLTLPDRDFYLVKDNPRFTAAVEAYRAYLEKLLTFALGRGIEHYDAPAIRKIVADARKDNYRFSRLIVA